MCCLTVVQITMQAINCKHDFEVRVLGVKKLKQIVWSYCSSTCVQAFCPGKPLLGSGGKQVCVSLLANRLSVLANLC